MGLKSLHHHVGQLERRASEKPSMLACLCPALVLEDTFDLEPCKGGTSNEWMPGAVLVVPTVALYSSVLKAAA